MRLGHHRGRRRRVRGGAAGGGLPLSGAGSSEGTPGIRLRPWADADARASLDVFRRAVHGTARRDYSVEQLAAWAPDDIPLAEWASRRRAGGTVVAEVAGHVVGFTGVDAAGHVDMLYVDPAAARTGVATALLEHVVATGRRRGLRELTTDASITARPVFERHGFVVVAEQRPVRRGVALTNFRMRRELGPGTGAGRGPGHTGVT